MCRSRCCDICEGRKAYYAKTHPVLYAVPFKDGSGNRLMIAGLTGFFTSRLAAANYQNAIRLGLNRLTPLTAEPPTEIYLGDNRKYCAASGRLAQHPLLGNVWVLSGPLLGEDDDTDELPKTITGPLEDL